MKSQFLRRNVFWSLNSLFLLPLNDWNDAVSGFNFNCRFHFKQTQFQQRSRSNVRCNQSLRENKKKFRLKCIFCCLFVVYRSVKLRVNMNIKVATVTPLQSYTVVESFWCYSHTHTHISFATHDKAEKMQSKMLILIEIHETSLAKTCLQPQSVCFCCHCYLFLFGRFDSWDKIQYAIANKFVLFISISSSCCINRV